MAKVAFLGLGVMGYPMAGHLKNKGGHEVTVYNRTGAKAEQWVKQHGGRSAPTPKAAAEGQDVVMACVGNDNDLREVMLAFSGSRAVGFAELNIRPYAEGCDTDRVAYLEGWFVAADMRRNGVGTAIIRAAEEWGRAQGCTEFASDALVDNIVSAKAHLAAGFREVEVTRCFAKRL